MARNFHPERHDPRGLQKNQRALEELLEKLFDRADGDELFVVLAGRSGGQTILQGVTLEGGVVVNDLGEDVDFRVEGDTEPNLLVVDASTDRMGIGTASPLHRLHILQPDGATLLVEATNAAGGANAELHLKTNVREWTLRSQRFGGALLIRDETAGNAVVVLEAGAPANTIYVNAVGNIGLLSSGSFGGGVGVLFLGNRTTAPSTAPVGGVLFYSEDVSGSARLKLLDEAGLNPTVGGVLFAQTADKTVTNTTTETSVLGTGIGSLTLPADSLTVGRTLKVRIGGVYSTPSIGTPSITVRVKIGSTTIAQGTTTAIGTSATDLRFVGELLITVRSVGATGSVVLDGGILYNAPGSNEPVSDPLSNSGNPTTVDTTVANAFDVTAQWDSASASREVKSTVATVEVVN